MRLLVPDGEPSTATKVLQLFSAARLYTGKDHFIIEDIMRIATVERIAKTITTLDHSTAFQETLELRDRLAASLERSKVLGGFELLLDSETPRVDGQGFPYIQLQYRKIISTRYASELTFTLTKGQFRGFVSTLHLTDGLGSNSQNSTIAGNGEFRDEVKFYNVEGLAKLAVQRAVEHRVTLLQDLGFTVSPHTLKKLSKAAGSLAF
jgi:hypothetical protein